MTSFIALPVWLRPLAGDLLATLAQYAENESASAER